MPRGTGWRGWVGFSEQVGRAGDIGPPRFTKGIGMARRKKRGPGPRPNRPTGPPLQFARGARVRVKAGVRDPDFPDFPLGGAVGTIVDVNRDERPPTYHIEWEEETLGKMHPVYRVRCERQDLDHETIWLDEDDLEPAPDGPVTIEQPGDLVAPSLDPDDEFDRIRELFGLTGDDPVPEVSQASLTQFHEILSGRLTFPLAALYREQGGPLFGPRAEPILVLRLLPPEEAEPEAGLLVEVRRGDESDVLPLWDVDLAEQDPQHQLLSDYSFWMTNAEREEEALLPFGPPGMLGGSEEEAGSPATFFGMMARVAVYLAGAGAMVGAVVGGVEGARTGVLVGAGVLAVVGILVGTSLGRFYGRVNQMRGGAFLGGLFGGLAGGGLGALGGALAVAFAGSILGSIAGSLVGVALARVGFRPWGVGLWTLLGAMVGALVLALIRNQEAALPTALWGALLAGVGGVVVMLAAMVTMALLMDHEGPG
jgi:hypothetical protein